jgi:uncharacterized membrane protein YgaE (UPF0421/DUF939 family)
MSDVWAKRFPILLATYWSLVATIYIAAITFANIPAPNIRFADTILGFVLGTVVATIINFFLGSSQGSKDKEGKLKEINNDSTV